MSKQTLVRLSLCLVLCVATMWASSSAEAIPSSCGREVVITYYAWIDNNDPNAYWCSPPLCGPCGQPIDEYAHWAPIGGTYRFCDGETSSWGNTLCTEPENTEMHGSPCDC